MQRDTADAAAHGRSRGGGSGVPPAGPRCAFRGADTGRARRPGAVAATSARGLGKTPQAVLVDFSGSGGAGDCYAGAVNPAIHPSPAAPQSASTALLVRRAVLVAVAAVVASGGIWQTLNAAELSARRQQTAPRELAAAVQAGDFAAATRLLEAGVNPNAGRLAGEKDVLMLAVERSDTPPEFVRALLVRGANPNSTDRDGRTPLVAAQAAGNDSLTGLLRAAGGTPATLPAPADGTQLVAVR